jgi:hypothetical protein
MYRRLLVSILYKSLKRQAVRAQERFSNSTARCAEIQREVLLDKLRWASGTEYGRRHSFSRLSTPEEYRRAVPIVDYEDMAPSIARIVNGEKNILFPAGEKLLMFAMTSGTTSTPKYIPITKKYLRELERGNFIWGSTLALDHPTVINHKILHIVSPSREKETPLGIPCGAATGLVAESQKRIAHIKYALKGNVHGIRDYAVKYYCILRLAMQQKISLLIAANPSTLVTIGHNLKKNAHRLLKDLYDGTLAFSEELPPRLRQNLFRRLKKMRRRASVLEHILNEKGHLLPCDVWPELQVIACWTGGTLTPYLEVAKRYWGERPLRDPGLIASEGRMTIPMVDGEEGGALDVESHFYEFLPYETEGAGAETLLAHELEEGKNYYILLTTSSGLYRYNISDVVQVNGHFGCAPILKFLNKGSRISSLTGEKITEHQVVEAFRACTRELCMSVPQFAICPGWNMPPFYYILLEADAKGAFTGETGNHLRDTICTSLDTRLKELNIEYKNKRESGRLGRPMVRLIKKGAFEMNKMVHIKKSGGRVEQYKHTFLSPLLDYHTRFPVADPSA